MSRYVHRYICDVCGRAFTAEHKDDMLYCDPCPECTCDDNVPQDVEKVDE